MTSGNRSVNKRRSASRERHKLDGSVSCAIEDTLTTTRCARVVFASLSPCVSAFYAYVCVRVCVWVGIGKQKREKGKYRATLDATIAQKKQKKYHRKQTLMQTRRKATTINKTPKSDTGELKKKEKGL